jgi:hypothetical protein
MGERGNDEENGKEWQGREGGAAADSYGGVGSIIEQGAARLTECSAKRPCRFMEKGWAVGVSFTVE